MDLYADTINLEKLRALRNASGSTINMMADVIGQTSGNYWKKETGVHKIGIVEAKQLADYFGVTIEDLFFNSCDADDVVMKYLKHRRKNTKE